MPITINGFGTRCYGKKWQDDGTYITTKYAVVFWIPVAKISTHRVQPFYPRELQKGPARTWSNLKDFAYVIVAMGLLFLGLPVLLRWLH